jgi:hypothetical protein
MKEIFSRLLAVLLLVTGLDLIHCHPADVGLALAAESNEDLQPLITTSELIVGENRFAFGLIKSDKLLESADVQLRIYSIDGPEPHLVAETNALYHPIGTTERGGKVHRHADGTAHVHSADSDVRGLYVARLAFARPGPWGVELQARDVNGSLATARLTVTVSNASQTPAFGSPAPRSRNVVASEVRDLRQIDTSQKPDPRLHQVRIADAIVQRKPQLIVFATPQFCTSRMCGPVVDVVRQLLPAYNKRVAFIHQEIWQDFANKKLFPTVEEWRLVSEPWTFVVDGEGIIRGKFEGLVTGRELEAALQEVLQLNAQRHH